MRTKFGRPLMIVGYGSVGQYLLDMILEDPRHRFYNNVVIVSRSPYEKVEPRLNTSIIAGMIKNNSLDDMNVHYEQCDLKDTTKLAAIIKAYNPKMIVQCARFYSGVKYGSFSYPNEIGYGVWSPMSVVPIKYLMKAVELSKCETYVVNTSYPDVTNAWIASAGMRAPLCGAGNINHLIPRIALAYKEKEGVLPYNIHLTCSHYTNTYVSKEGNPKGNGYILKIGNKTYSESEAKDLFSHCKIPMETGATRNLMIASDCYLITKGDWIDIHLPGPNGMVGGYSCVLRPFVDNYKVCLYDSTTADDQIAANQEGISLDGVFKVEDGYIFFTEEVRRKMKSVFDLDYPEKLHLSEAEKFAKIIMDRLKRWRGSN